MTHAPRVVPWDSRIATEEGIRRKCIHRFPHFRSLFTRLLARGGGDGGDFLLYATPPSLDYPSQSTRRPYRHIPDRSVSIARTTILRNIPGLNASFIQEDTSFTSSYRMGLVRRNLRLRFFSCSHTFHLPRAFPTLLKAIFARRSLFT